ncbi:MAG: GNAT family N-acetyltransferase [Bacteroidales bacterium]|nr:GNAT family N-acetyltransferase [Bacteroidales bacterium]
MPITYTTTHTFTAATLQDLFLSVDWSSGHYPEKLVVAMQNFKTVISAWDGDKLIGMICAMDDGIMNAYVHYLLVRPEYQGKSRFTSIAAVKILFSHPRRRLPPCRTKRQTQGRALDIPCGSLHSQ